jgi:hypothetical protein
VERLSIVAAGITKQLVDHEPELRASLRLSLDATRPSRATPLRQGRAITWIADALSPLRRRLGERGVHRLTLAIRATLGIEAFVWLVDVGRLSRRDAAELMQSSARTLLEAAMR